MPSPHRYVRRSLPLFTTTILLAVAAAVTPAPAAAATIRCDARSAYLTCAGTNYSDTVSVRDCSYAVRDYTGWYTFYETRATIYGYRGNDVLDTYGACRIGVTFVGGPGNDLIYAHRGGSTDRVLCGTGYDTVFYDSRDVWHNGTDWVSSDCERRVYNNSAFT